jgi:hypothetical protein
MKPNVVVGLFRDDRRHAAPHRHAPVSVRGSDDRAGLRGRVPRRPDGARPRDAGRLARRRRRDEGALRLRRRGRRLPRRGHQRRRVIADGRRLLEGAGAAGFTTRGHGEPPHIAAEGDTMAKNFVKPGQTLTLTAPTGGVTTGVGVLIGTIFASRCRPRRSACLRRRDHGGVWDLAKNSTPRCGRRRQDLLGQRERALHERAVAAGCASSATRRPRRRTRRAPAACASAGGPALLDDDARRRRRRTHRRAASRSPPPTSSAARSCATRTARRAPTCCRRRRCSSRRFLACASATWSTA